MSLQRILDRLGTDERWWAAEVILRAAGLALFGLASLAALWLARSVRLPAPHPATGREFLAAYAAVVSGCGGALLTFFGAWSFKRMPLPRGRTALSLWPGEDGSTLRPEDTTGARQRSARAYRRPRRSAPARPSVPSPGPQAFDRRQSR
jgi:hypothetical protein